MKVERLIVGPMEVNCYVVIDEESKEAVIIDPGAEADKILQFVQEAGVEVKYIINTHGHIDHIAANPEVVEATKGKLLIHEQDADFLKNPELNLSTHVGQGEFKSPPPDRLLKEGDKVEFGNADLEVLHTPGHTPGGICLLGEKVIFTGDTLFTMGVGRTDFPRASYEQLEDSLTKVLDQDVDLKLYPGHGPVSTLEKVKKKNIYL